MRKFEKLFFFYYIFTCLIPHLGCFLFNILTLCMVNDAFNDHDKVLDDLKLEINDFNTLKVNNFSLPKEKEEIHTNKSSE